MTARRAALTCAWIGALAFLLGGAWALFAPRSFFDVAATYPPYNPHLFHDVGAFQLGIAAGLLAGIFGRSGLAVGLLTVVAAALVAGLVAAEARRAARGPQPARTSRRRSGR